MPGAKPVGADAGGIGVRRTGRPSASYWFVVTTPRASLRVSSSPTI